MKLPVVWEEVVNSLDSAVVLADRDRRVILLNRAAEEALAKTSEDVTGLPVRDCLPWLTEFSSAVDECLAEGRTYIFPVRTQGGGILRVSLCPYRVPASSPENGGFLVVFHPAGMESRDKERLAFESMNEVVARIAHEIRTPLGGIRGAAQLLGGSGDGGEHAAVIVREVDRLRGILQELLIMARPAPPTVVPVNVHEVVEQACAVLRPEIERSRVQIVRKFDPSLPDVAADPGRLLQVFLNIIQNAVQIMSDGGRVEIASRPGSEHLQTPDGTTRRWAVVTIADTGPGIPEEHLGRIFLPYHTTRPGGTGLGLAISKKIMLDFDGFLEAANRPGGGAVFTVVVPFTHTGGRRA